MKIFVNCINSPIGHMVYEELRNDDVLESDFHSFTATIDHSDETAHPEGIYTFDRKKEYLKSILDCDLIILDLFTGDLEDFEEILKSLKDYSGTSSKTVILVSSVFTWGDTPLKLAPNQENTSKVEDSVITTNQDNSLIDTSVVKSKKQFVPFEDSEFFMRKAYPKYESWKNLENLCLSCNKNENLQSYVLCSGILYGFGEILFSYHFMSGWLGEVESLPYISPGDNIVPTVHIADLAKMVKFVVDYLPSSHYLIGCDHASDSQLSIVQAISGAMSDGKINAVSYPDVMLEQWAEAFSLHLLVKTSNIFDSLNWHSEKGVVANIDLLNQEFNVYRALRSVKVFVNGPPLSGKSHFSRKLAEYYNVPHLHVGALIQEVLHQQSELGEKIRKKLAELKQHMIDEAESKKKKNQEIDYSKFNPRVPEELVAEIVKSKLNSNICRNRGYVLDGWPRKYEDAKRLFCTDDENLDVDIYPDSVILIKATNEFLITRAKALPEQLVIGSHYNDEGMKRRLQFYRDVNIPDKQSLQDFFIIQKTEVFEAEASADENLNFEGFIKFIERKGKPFKYAVQDEPKMQETFLNFDSMKNLKEEESKKIDAGQNVEYLIMMEQIRAKENNLLELKSQPIRNYMMEKVAPAIAEGLFALCEQKPEDPVEFLAKFLKGKSQQTKGK